MKVNSNIGSMIAARHLRTAQAAIARSLERLSSGNQLLRPAEGVAEFSASISLQAERRGLIQGILNLNQSRGVLEVADGAADSLISIVQRMRELALQSANETLSINDRQSLATEFDTLIEEFRRISDTTDYNFERLTDGSYGTRRIQLGTSNENSLDLELPDLREENIFTDVFGTRSFGHAQRISTSSVRYSPPALADFNDDGNLDMVMPNTYTNNLGVYFGNGTGQFSIQSTLSNYGTNGTPSVGDVNGDGAIDLLVGYASGGLGYMGVLLNNGHGSFSQASTISTTVTGSAAGGYFYDLDNDDDLDIVMGDYGGGGISTYLNDGSGAFTLRYTATGVTASLGGKATDINSDGIMDLVVAGQNPGFGLRYALGAGDGTFGSFTLIAGFGVSDYNLADLNGDGLEDIVATGNTARIYLNNGVGGFTYSKALTPTGNNARGVLTGDFDNDRQIDIAVSDSVSSTLEIFWGRGNLDFTSATVLTSPNQTFGIAMGDVDNDTITDFISTGAGTTDVSIHRQGSTISSAVSYLDISTSENSRESLDLLDTALENLMTHRVSLGSQLERMDYAQTATERLADDVGIAASLLKDADIASETAELIKAQIQAQVATFVAAQANLNLQTILLLLRP